MALSIWILNEIYIGNCWRCSGNIWKWQQTDTVYVKGVSGIIYHKHCKKLEL